MKTILLYSFFMIIPVALVEFLSILQSVRRHAKDYKIDDLIKANQARPCRNMEVIDWQKTNRAGERTWAITLRGQRRYATQVLPQIKKTDESKQQVH